MLGAFQDIAHRLSRKMGGGCFLGVPVSKPVVSFWFRFKPQKGSLRHHCERQHPCLVLWLRRQAFFASFLVPKKKRRHIFAFGQTSKRSNLRAPSNLKSLGPFSPIAKWLLKNRNSKMVSGKHGPKPAVCPSCVILSHTQMGP